MALSTHYFCVALFAEWFHIHGPCCLACFLIMQVNQTKSNPKMENSCFLAHYCEVLGEFIRFLTRSKIFSLASHPSAVSKYNAEINTFIYVSIYYLFLYL